RALVFGNVQEINKYSEVEWVALTSKREVRVKSKVRIYDKK
ncbi:20002_t:CDS:1, partial [Gigaspora rosea]